MSRFLGILTMAMALGAASAAAAPPHLRPRVHHRFYYRPYLPSFAFSLGYHPYFAPRPHPIRSQKRPGAQSYSPHRGAVRMDVSPKQTELIVDGRFAGVADDFDGIFQRLYLDPGEHEIELRLEGWETHRVSIDIEPGQTVALSHRMKERERVPREREPSPTPPPLAEPEERRERPAPTFSRPERFGALVVRIQPTDAEIWIDGKLWGSLEGFDRLPIHLTTGTHEVEIRRAGYESFSASVEIRPGRETALNVRLDETGR